MRIVKLTLALAAVMPVVLVAYGVAEFHRLMFPRPERLTSLWRLQELTGLQFPSGSRVNDGWSSGGLNTRLIAQITIPRDGLEQFLKQPALAHRSTRTPAEFAEFNADLIWNLRHHRIDRGRRYLARSGSTDQSRLFDLLVDLDDRAAPVAYLVMVIW